MKLYDGRKVMAGLVVFVALVSLPLWYNLANGRADAAPELQLPDPNVHPHCVAPVDYMRSSHMELLNDWRNSVVRKGERIYEAYDGTKYDKSLSHTCLGCHESKKQFCDQCHGFMGVAEPYCWNCHIDPTEVTQ